MIATLVSPTERFQEALQTTNPFHVVSDNEDILLKMSILAKKSGYRVRRYTVEMLVVDHERENLVKEFERAISEQVVILLQLRPGERHLIESVFPKEAERIENNSIWFPSA